MLLVDKATFPRDKPCGGGAHRSAARACSRSRSSRSSRTRIDRLDCSFRYRDAASPAARAGRSRDDAAPRLDAFLARSGGARPGRRGARGRRPIDATRGDARQSSSAPTGATAPRARRSASAAGSSTASRSRATSPTDRRRERYARRWCSSSPSSPAATAGSSRRATTSTSGSAGWQSEGPRLREHLAPPVRRARDRPGRRPSTARPPAADAHARDRARARERALLVGDAAGLVDPFSGDGMYEAFASAQLAAAAALDILAGRASGIEPYADAVARRITPLTRAGWGAKRAFDRFPRPPSCCASPAELRTPSRSSCAASSSAPATPVAWRKARCGSSTRSRAPRPKDGPRNGRSLRRGPERPAPVCGRAGRERHPPQVRAAADPPSRRPDRRARRALRSATSSSPRCSELVGARAPRRLERFETDGDLDIAYAGGGAAALPRQRLPAARRHSFAFRVIPRELPTLRAARPAAGGRARSPTSTAASSSSPAPPAPARRRRSAAMIDYINRTSRAAHHHDRGPDRDPPRRPQLHRQPARGRPRHETLRSRRSAARSARTRTSILIGELRDAETAQTALQAAESGHLVLSTHAHDRRRRDVRPHDRVLPAREAGGRSARSWPASCAA